MTTILAILVAPIILAVVNHLLTRAAKREDWKRQDEVADKVERAAALLIEGDERRAEEAQRTSDKLDVIHGLVNSDMTERIRGQLHATETSLVSLKALMAHRTLAGIPATDEEHAAIDVTEQRIAELNTQLADREALKEGGDLNGRAEKG